LVLTSAEKLSDDTDEFNEDDEDDVDKLLFRVLGSAAIMLGCSLSLVAGSFSDDSDLGCCGARSDTKIFWERKEKKSIPGPRIP
jgi:hypothetical protein